MQHLVEPAVQEAVLNLYIGKLKLTLTLTLPLTLTLTLTPTPTR